MVASLFVLSSIIHLPVRAATLPNSGTGQDFFQSHPVWSVEIELSAQAIARLKEESRTYVPAVVRICGEELRGAGVHLKGRGSFQSIQEKPSWTVDFGRFSKGQTLHGFEKIHLNNSVEDPSYLKDQIATELFRAANIPVPRVAHAQVRLNDRELGFYVVKEGFTQGFLARHFHRADGNLYEPAENRDIDQPMKRHLGRAMGKDQPELKRLASAALEPDLKERWKHLRELLDVDRFVDFLAIEIIAGQWDGYGLGKNNFRVYHDPGSGKIVFLPSGMDQAFAKPDMSWKPQMTGLMARSILALPEGRQLYEKRFRELFGRLLVSERLSNRVEEIVAQLRPSLTRQQFQSVGREARELCRKIGQREKSLKQQLSEPELAALNFRGDVALLSGWKPSDGSMPERTPQIFESKAVLRISAMGKAAGSWRTAFRLGQGRYEFVGNAKVVGVSSLTFGKHHGASLRMFGKPGRSAELIGASSWQTLRTEFEVALPEEVVVAICELRAAAGEVYFDKESLQVVRKE